MPDNYGGKPDKPSAWSNNNSTGSPWGNNNSDNNPWGNRTNTQLNGNGMKKAVNRTDSIENAGDDALKSTDNVVRNAAGSIISSIGGAARKTSEYVKSGGAADKLNIAKEKADTAFSNIKGKAEEKIGEAKNKLNSEYKTVSPMITQDIVSDKVTESLTENEVINEFKDETDITVNESVSNDEQITEMGSDSIVQQVEPPKPVAPINRPVQNNYQRTVENNQFRNNNSFPYERNTEPKPVTQPNYQSNYGNNMSNTYAQYSQSDIKQPNTQPQSSPINNNSSYNQQNYVQNPSGKSTVMMILIVIILVLLIIIGVVVGIIFGKNSSKESENNTVNDIVYETTSVNTEHITTETTVLATTSTEKVVETTTTAQVIEKLVNDPEKVRNAYINKLTEFAGTDYYFANNTPAQYALYDVNGDGTEELFIKYEEVIGTAGKLYVYDNGRYVETANCADGSMFEICSDKGLVQWTNYGGGSSRTIITIGDNGTSTETLSEYSGSYQHNSKGISRDEFNQLNNEYDGLKWVSPNFKNFNTLLSDSVLFNKPRETYAFLGVVNTDSTDLNVRKQPSTSAQIIGSVPKGAYVNVYYIDGYSDWYKIEYSDKNISGYASAKYIINSANYTPSNNTNYGNGSVGKVITSSDPLNMRSGPSSDYEVMCKIPKGDYVDILEYCGDWLYVRYSTGSVVYTGYVNSKFIQVS